MYNYLKSFILHTGKKPKDIFNNWWLSISIKHKIVYFLRSVATMVIVMVFFSIAMVIVYLRDFNIILGDSYLVNNAFVCFEAENAVFRNVIFQNPEDAAEAYNTAREKTHAAIRNLKYDIDAINAERYMLTQALREAYLTYSERTEIAVESRGTYDFYDKYDSALQVSGYISKYFQELMQETLNEGTEKYNQKVELLRFVPFLLWMMCAAICLFAFKSGSIALRDIIRPVIIISDAAGEIACENFDIPDIHLKNQDEIGRLAKTFNAMKNAMSHSIVTLKEKNQMEKLLHQQEIRRIAMEQELKDMQLSMLQSQINPHFLFNTLNTIRSTAVIEDAKNTQELIEKLANLFRYNLSSVKERVTLSREINIIQDYMFIQHRRFGHRISFRLDSNVDMERFTIPAFTLQPLVENAMIHGIAPREEGGCVRIRIRQIRGYLVIFITDNGLGIPKEELKPMMSGEAVHEGHLSHIGLSNVKSRIEMLYAQSHFQLLSKSGMGTSVRLKIPVQRSIEE